MVRHPPGFWGLGVSDKFPQLKISSFPPARESSPFGTEIYRVKRFLRFYVLDSRLRGNDGRWGVCFSDKVLWFFGYWIPACAGMTVWCLSVRRV